ncbi:MAG: squalene--hopene cyclase [Planctomycetota bacterium]
MTPPLLIASSDTSTTDALGRCLEQAGGWLAREQHAEGYWLGRLLSNSTMEAEWILLQHVLGLGRSDPKFDGVVRAILAERREDGSWAVYNGAPEGELSSTVECYAALRVAGISPDAEPMKQTRRWIQAHGGMTRLRNFTKYWLALLGEWSWDHVPALPPEVIGLPHWFPTSLYRFSSWARATIVPLAVLASRRHTVPLPSEARLDELVPGGRDRPEHRLPKKRGFGWHTLFQLADTCLRLYERYSPVKPLRESAIKLCLEWLLKHQEADGAWGGIQPPWVWGLMALHAEGYALKHPVLVAGIKAFEEPWSWRVGDATYIQASNSPVWDTGLMSLALLDAETPATDPRLIRAVDWLLEQEVRTWGDWQQNVEPDVEPGGWAFEFANDAYPDADDTAVVLSVLVRMRESLANDPDQARRVGRIDAAVERAEAWLRGLQSTNGGWAAFDKDNDTALITKIPFCDFGEVLDPPSVDVTAHVLEAFALRGATLRDPAVNRAVTWILAEQEPEGSWFGRWGCNHVYGTGAVLPGLAAVGFDMRAECVLRAARWLVAHQNADGGWGETCASYVDRASRGKGPSTPSQTAWGLLGLLSVPGQDFADAIQRGLRWLLERQRPDGTWDEAEYTATGFPGYGTGARLNSDAEARRALGQDESLQRAFMIRYDLYRHYFPIMAVARARAALGE